MDHAMGASDFHLTVSISIQDGYIYRTQLYEFRRAGLFLMGSLGKDVTGGDFTPVVHPEAMT